MADDRNGGGPLLRATRLWEKTSAKGGRYLTGRLGGLRVLVMENRDRRDPEDASHVLMFGEAAQREGGER